MDPLGNPLTTRPILTGWGFTMEPYPSGQFGFIDDPDRQFGNGLVGTQTRARSDGPELLLTLSSSSEKVRNLTAKEDLYLLLSFYDTIPMYNIVRIY